VERLESNEEEHHMDYHGGGGGYCSGEITLLGGRSELNSDSNGT
jgi:hypothetical protein